MAAMSERHTEHRIARVQGREKHRLVRLCSRMRLNVRVTGSEQLFRAIDRELLGDVDVLAAAVITLPGITFGVLVRKHRALRMQNARARVIFGSDELDVLFLSAVFLFDRAPDVLVERLESFFEGVHGWGRS